MVGLSRMISLSARSGCSIESIVDQLKSSGSCPSYAVRRATKNDTSKGSCCPIAVGNALMDMYEELQEELGYTDEIITEKLPSVNLKTNNSNNFICPECREEGLVYESGCNSCKNCGYSRCG